LETRSRTRGAAVTVAFGSVATRRVRALVATTVFARPERAFPTVAASRRPVAIGSITAGPRCIAVIAARRTIVALSGIRTALTFGLTRKTALGKFLLRPPGSARAALAARRTVAPAPRVVVFVVVAGHERSHFGCMYK
jgi:hypothetical protein